MMFFALLKIAFGSLLANKLRSGLTLLGVVIGVTSVMTIMSALEGMMEGIENELGRLGPATFVVTTMGAVITSEEQWRELLKRKPIDLKLADELEESCDLCEKVASRSFTRSDIKYRDKKMRRVLVAGATYNLVDIVDIEVAQGRFHSREDDLNRRQVVFIGDQLREEFFEGIDPIDKEIRVGGRRFTVIGVAKKMGSLFGNNRDNFVLIPQSTQAKLFGEPRRSRNFTIKAFSVEQLDDAMDQVRVFLRSQRQVPFNKPDDFSLLTANNILGVFNAVTQAFRLGLVGISSISLLVGGIVVMNIMMVSVSERTREIGIRKAIGAKQNHILVQFLLEALLTTFSGGLIGIVLGYIIAEALVGWFGMQISPSTLAISAGLLISIGTGLIFGIYPAMKAARLDPIKALSYE